MILNDLYYYKDSYNKPYVFGINWESNLAPDKNFTVGIGILGYLFAASLSGKQYICTEPNNGWQLIIDPSAITADIANLKTSFQDGCNSIVEGLTGIGFAPTNNSPWEIRVAIQRVYDERYSSGYNSGYSAGRQDATVSFTQTRASQISFYNPGYHYFDISASESGYDYLIVSGWFSGRITAVEVSNSATKVLVSKILSTGEGTNTMVHCILKKPANSCRIKFNHSGSGNGYVIVYGAK